MFKRIRAIVKKELYHILRDPRTLAIIFVMPVLMVLIFGYALNMDIEHIKLGVVDNDHTPESRALVRSYASSKYFDIAMTSDNRDDLGNAMNRSEIKAGLIIPEGFGEECRTAPVSHVQMLIDGSDPTFGNAAMNYASAIAFSHSITVSPVENRLPLDVRERFLFNPDLKGSHFVIPGIVAVILMMVCALLTSITIAREKETGTMEILLVSPIHPGEIIVGKVMPYIFIALLDAVFILTFSRVVFGIPIRGDLVLLLFLSIVYVYSALAMGLLISSIAPTQQVAMMAALVGTILPSILLSGFIFSIFSMPKPIQIFTYIVPARHYMVIIRGILLKSSTLGLLKEPVLMLIVIGTLFLTIATLRFKTRTK